MLLDSSPDGGADAEPIDHGCKKEWKTEGPPENYKKHKLLADTLLFLTSFRTWISVSLMLRILPILVSQI